MLPETSKKHLKQPNSTTYNLIRVVAMMMVLATHTLGTTSQFKAPYNTTWYVNSALTSLFMVCNPLFFMLSGKFNLNKKFNSLQDYIVFYYKKTLSLVVPFVAFSILFYLIDRAFIGCSITGFIKDFMAGNIVGVYWFMYALIGITVFSPFFSKMMQSMSLLDKQVFFWILILTNSAVTIYLATGHKSAFTYNTFGIIIWHLFYFIGYILEDVLNTRRKENIFITLGIIAFGIHFLQKRYLTNIPLLTHDPNLWTIFEAIAIYLIITRIQIKSDSLKNTIKFFSDISFYFYLIHMHILIQVASYFPRNISTYHNALYTIIIYIITFVICGICSYLIHQFIMKPFVKFASKLLQS